MCRISGHFVVSYFEYMKEDIDFESMKWLIWLLMNIWVRGGEPSGFREGGRMGIRDPF